MNDDIVNQNADGQEVLQETPAATTNSPVEANAEAPQAIGYGN